MKIEIEKEYRKHGQVGQTTVETKVVEWKGRKVIFESINKFVTDEKIISKLTLKEFNGRIIDSFIEEFYYK